MYGLPTQLYPIPQGMFDDQSSCFGVSIDRQVFYSIKDGNWSDMSVWETVSGKVGRLPTANDDVYIRYGTTVTVNIAASVNNLFIAGTMKGNASAWNLSVFGNIKSVGNVDFTLAATNLTLYGIDNYIDNFISGNSTVTYARPGDQYSMPLVYNHFNTVNNVGYKYITEGTIINGNMFIDADTTLLTNLVIEGNWSVNQGSPTKGKTFEMGNYDFTVLGSTTIRTSGVSNILSKNGSGRIVFEGLLTIYFSTINFSGNPDIEFRGGLSQTGTGFGTFLNFGTGNVLITTNDQTFSVQGTRVYFKDVIISGAITVTTGGGGFLIVNSITGDNSASTLVNNNATLGFTSNTLPMYSNGIYDFTTYPNTLGYFLSGDYTLPYTYYKGLFLEITGTTTLLGNTVIDSSGLTLSNSVLDLNTFNFTVNGTSVAMGQFSSVKSLGSNFIYFYGPALFFNVYFLGSPMIEFHSGARLFFGTQIYGVVTFKENDQTLDSQGGNPININADIIIDGIILTESTLDPTNRGFAFYGSINGTTPGSKMIVKENVTNASGNSDGYKSAILPMTTGILDCTTYNNKWRYNLAGDQEVKGTTYYILEFGGSGVKKLMGNVIVNVSAGGSWSITGTATIDYNGFTITTI